jgi:hypothetical protein
MQRIPIGGVYVVSDRINRNIDGSRQWLIGFGRLIYSMPFRYAVRMPLPVARHERDRKDLGIFTNREVLRVQWIVRWHHNDTGQPLPESCRYESKEFGPCPRNRATRYDSAKEARASLQPAYFDPKLGVCHVRVVRVLRKVT